jgi:hypothetical protein
MDPNDVPKGYKSVFNQQLNDSYEVGKMADSPGQYSPNSTEENVIKITNQPDKKFVELNIITEESTIIMKEDPLEKEPLKDHEEN